MDTEQFAKVYNDVENFPRIADVADELGVVDRTVRIKARKLRKQLTEGKDVPVLVSRSSVPLSEDERKFMEHWTPEDCIEELNRVQSEDPEHFITRNYFRNNSAISDSTWNRYFGTFHEFKRQAGIVLTRQQAAMERHIAKHASVDHYRKLSSDRQDWSDKYIRENQSRFKTVLACSDLHDVEIDQFFLRVLIDTARRVQPDVIIFNGDIRPARVRSLGCRSKRMGCCGSN